jgi:hypothetical protein
VGDAGDGSVDRVILRDVVRFGHQDRQGAAGNGKFDDLAQVASIARACVKRLIGARADEEQAGLVEEEFTFQGGLVIVAESTVCHVG